MAEHRKLGQAHRVSIYPHSRLLSLALLLGIMALPSTVMSATAPHGSVELVADTSHVQPGRPFWVGFHFQLEPGWHIYWINPGDSGEPPRIKWNLPAGYQAGSIVWPTPERIVDHSLIDYGYQNDVLLPVEITPPSSLGVGSGAQLSGTLKWLVCREMCLPARADLALNLPLKGTSGPSPQHALFDKARAQLPVPSPKTWKLTASPGLHTFTLTIDTGKRESEATFFPLEPNQIDNAAPQKVTAIPRGVRLDLVKSDQLLKPPTSLKGVLELAPHRSYTIVMLVNPGK
jgi:DsbC/DsbD-like thiol-disulfide interchange protein